MFSKEDNISRDVCVYNTDKYERIGANRQHIQ